jgi:hypothetical protein
MSSNEFLELSIAWMRKIDMIMGHQSKYVA